MLVISAGMQKSGSAYFYNIINAVLAESATGVDARTLTRHRNTSRLMSWHNNSIGNPTALKLVKLWRMSRQVGSFAVKTHEGPTPTLRLMSQLGKLRVVYCYRDPRDAVLSAMDHGKKILADGEEHTFAKLVEFESALSAAKGWVEVYEKYANIEGALAVKYEDMMCDPVTVTKGIEKFLGISLVPERREEILWRYSKDNPNGDRRGMHFNKPSTFRYITEMTAEQKRRCKEVLGPMLQRMGYELDRAPIGEP